ncbi:hypothetical protein [Streptomyces flaveolus]|uniref:hypothetical protein n=1 Tax=Streptomyces flaveolus TaxID=67297 RepID=UPI0036FB5E9F
MESKARTSRLPRQATGPGADQAVIVGGSLAGLMTGLALSRSEVEVTLLERVGSFPRSGASLGGVDEQLLARLTCGATPPPGSMPLRSVTSGIQPWDFFHQRLRAAAEADERIAVHHRTRVIRGPGTVRVRRAPGTHRSAPAGVHRSRLIEVCGCEGRSPTRRKALQGFSRTIVPAGNR